MELFHCLDCISKYLVTLNKYTNLQFNEIEESCIHVYCHIGKTLHVHFATHRLNIQQSLPKHRSQCEKVLSQFIAHFVELSKQYRLSPYVEGFPVTVNIEELYLKGEM